MSDASDATKWMEAYVDEAGAKGFLRNLTASSDADVAVLAAICIPGHDSERFREALSGPFERFKNARPSGDLSLHITDAFGSGDANWAAVATTSRAEIFEAIKNLEVPVIYDARRLRLARTQFESREAIHQAAWEGRQSNIAMSRRPSDERVDEHCMIGLALKLDCLAEDCDLHHVDLFTDQLDSKISELFETMMDRTRSISKPAARTVKGWDRATKSNVSGTISISVKDAAGNPASWLDCKRLGNLVVLGKDDPFVFAADVVVNSLHHHLRQLAPDSPLNAPGSIEQWSLGCRVYGVREDAFEDKM